MFSSTDLAEQHNKTARRDFGPDVIRMIVPEMLTISSVSFEENTHLTEWDC